MTLELLDGTLPSAKEKKYDRQIRLWGRSGQLALEESHVLLLNFTSDRANDASKIQDRDEPTDIKSTCLAGFEALKNLVLAGIGKFTIVDPAYVTSQDLGGNFFLTRESKGLSRAKEVAKLLVQLNPSVEGNSVVQSASSYLETAIYSQYSLIFTSGPATIPFLSSIRSRCWDRHLPLIELRSMGFYGDVSIQLPPQFPVTDTHINPHISNQLRVLHSWKELDDLCTEICSPTNGVGINDLDDSVHSRIPYAIILLAYIQTWQATYEGEEVGPSCPAHWRQLSTQIAADERTNNPDHGEDNFKEAAKAALQLAQYTPTTSIPEDLADLFLQCQTSDKIDHSTSHFWIAICAIQEFVRVYGAVPVPGPIPDMTAATNEYVKLQTVYRNKAVRDVQTVTEIVRELEKSRDERKGDNPSIDEERRTRSEGPVSSVMIEQCCRNAAELRYFKGWKHFLPDDPSVTILSPANDPADIIKQMEFDDMDSALPIRIALTAFELVISEPRKLLSPQLTLDNELRQSVPIIEGAIHDRVDRVISQIKSRAILQNISNEVSLPDVDEGVISRIHNTAAELIRPVVAANVSVESTIATIASEESTQTKSTTTSPRPSPSSSSSSSSSLFPATIEVPELHNTAATIGGIAAQEAVKILTGQFITQNYSIVWDGVGSRVLVDTVM